MMSNLLIGAFTFMVTNMDDLLILSVYFASSKYKTSNIVIGQYLGIIILITISLLGLILGEFFDKRWISLLGFLPVVLGVKDLLQRSDNEDSPDKKTERSNFQFLNIALVTIANGGDNIGVYTPLFAITPREFIVLYIGIFMFFTGVWCFLGYYVVSHPLVKTVFSKYGKTILPYFLILLGLYILSGFFE